MEINNANKNLECLFVECSGKSVRSQRLCFMCLVILFPSNNKQPLPFSISLQGMEIRRPARV